MLWPIDRSVIAWVWGDGGYPSRAPYRDYHRYTTHRHRVHRIDGAPYDHEAALVQARADGAEFVAGVRERVAGGGVCVCALDTELLGHHWYEGPTWLRAVLDEANRQGLGADAARRRDAQPSPAAATAASRRAHRMRRAGGQGRTCAPGAAREWPGLRGGLAGRSARSPLAATIHRTGRCRELLALQCSDWAFLHDRDLSGAYPEERAAGHAAALAHALTEPADPALRSLAPWLDGWG